MKIDSSLAAIVTGGASGLGLAAVTALREVGARVAIFDLNPETGQKAAAETGAAFYRCDVNISFRSIRMGPAMVPFSPRLGHASAFASMAMELIRNGYVNGETVRLDGAIRMQPRRDSGV